MKGRASFRRVVFYFGYCFILGWTMSSLGVQDLFARIGIAISVGVPVWLLLVIEGRQCD